MAEDDLQVHTEVLELVLEDIELLVLVQVLYELVLLFYHQVLFQLQ